MNESRDDRLIDLGRPLGARPLQDADYRAMIETVADYAIFMLDMNGAIRSWNRGAKMLKGYDESEVLGRHFSMFYPQELVDRDWPAHELTQARLHGRFEDEGWRIRKDGTRFWANIVLTRLVSPTGELRGFTKITRDLSERRRQEEQLRGSEERFRLLVESVKDYAIYMLDPSGYVVSWNSGAEKNKGYKAAEIIGQHYSVFYPADLAATGAPQEELDVALNTGRYEDEGWRIRKDGSRFWAGVTLTAIYDETGRHRGFAKVTRDLSQNRRVSALEDEGRRITEFLAMLGHELRNPLAPMANGISILHTLELDSKPLIAVRDLLDRQVRQMTRLVDDLLDVSRITSGKIRIERKPVRLEDVVREAREAVEPAIRDKSHQLACVFDPDTLWVNGDRSRLVQVVSNLLGNAAKFTPRGGRIDVEVKRVGSTAEIRVRDNGAGVPRELQADIFDLFVQGPHDAARSQGGLGLGLSLTRQLVALHGGDVSLYSTGRPGAGSEFIIRLPASRPPLAKPARHAEARPRVLVVDDNRDAADSLTMLVESLGYHCTAVYDGIAGLHAAITDNPEVVLLDLALPGLSGLEVAGRIQAEIQEPPHLVAVTGYGQDSDRESSFKAGFEAHLSKPVDRDQLTLLLSRLTSPA